MLSKGIVDAIFVIAISSRVSAHERSKLEGVITILIITKKEQKNTIVSANGEEVW
jgi:hypothetical protein